MRFETHTAMILTFTTSLYKVLIARTFQALRSKIATNDILTRPGVFMTAKTDNIFSGWLTFKILSVHLETFPSSVKHCS
jgi:hypothetical protein